MANWPSSSTARTWTVRPPYGPPRWGTRPVRPERSLEPESGAGIDVLLQRVPDVKGQKNRLHLDLRTPALDAEVRRVLDLGATLLTSEPVTEDGWLWYILADPDGKRVLRAPVAGYPIGMSVQLNHTIVSCRDQQRSAAFLTGILGLPPATRFGHFLVVEADNGVSLDFAETSGAITAQHYAFLMGEEEFDAAFGRIRQQDLPYWADPGRRQAGVINTRDGGRGVYFEDPDGHLLELLTRPYGSGA
jgi:catechol 2,3-dioxygenase-like lactoylglutathione lyase family enzyme